MRTTVELPPDLMRAAKARSAERGESLKSLLARAVAAELQVQSIRAGRQAPDPALDAKAAAASAPVPAS